MWERTLQDLIRGLRANKKDEATFIGQAVDEIRKEVRSKDMDLKAAAVLKLTYLDMMGYDMNWAAFNVVEVMSSARVHLKSIGYLAATQSFTPETDVLMLVTNSIKKDLTAATPADVAIALNGISHVATHDLARDLSRDLIAQLNHSRAHIRKRAVVALFKVFAEYPDAIPAAMPRIREKLEDPDPGVIAATVNMLCELARRNPQDYLPLAPPLFQLLTTSSNNWMLIKIIKLFGSLCPHEPRLVKKLTTPISELISTTSAISLLYECVHTCIIGGMLQGSAGNSLATTCVQKLASFLQDSDHNLKYIALLALVKIVPSHPHLVAGYQDTILACVNHEDMSIRLRALDLVSAMVDHTNLQSIVQQLLSHLVQSDSSLPSAADALRQAAGGSAPPAPTRLSPAYRLLLAQRILAMCAQDTYAHVPDFEWLLSVLVDLAYVARAPVGPQLRAAFIDVVGRVRAARRYAVTLAVRLLDDAALLRAAPDEDACLEILWAAAWVAGEYCSELAEPQKLLPSLLSPDAARLAPETVAVYVHAAAKVLAFWAADLADHWTDDELAHVKTVVEETLGGLQPFVSNADAEVQERAAEAHQLLSFVKADLDAHRPRPPVPTFDGPTTGFEDATRGEPAFPKSLFLLRPLFAAHALGPVAPAAQASVPVPVGLDLDAWIVPPPPSEDGPGADDGEARQKKSRKGKEKEGAANGAKTKDGAKKKKKHRDADADHYQDRDVLDQPEETPEDAAELERRKAERLERQRDDPFYISDRPAASAANGHDVDAIPIVRLDDLPSPALTPARTPLLRAPSAHTPAAFEVDRVGEMPRNAVSPPVPSPLASGRGTPALVGTPRTPSGFPEYVVDEERVSAPAPIKVTRKKKGGAAAKPKRAKAKEAGEEAEPEY